MKAKDLPQKIKNMYDIKQRESGWLISKDPIYISIDDTTEIIETEINYMINKQGFAFFISKDVVHATVVIL